MIKGKRRKKKQKFKQNSVFSDFANIFAFFVVRYCTLRVLSPLKVLQTKQGKITSATVCLSGCVFDWYFWQQWRNEPRENNSCYTLTLGLKLNMDFIRAGYWKGLHDTISQYFAIRCILWYIVTFHSVHWNCQNRAVVYDLGSLNTSHYIENSADKLSQHNLIQNFLSSLFQQYWQITKHTDLAAKHQNWSWKCTLAL